MVTNTEEKKKVGRGGNTGSVCAMPDREGLTEQVFLLGEEQRKPTGIWGRAFEAWHHKAQRS